METLFNKKVLTFDIDMEQNVFFIYFDINFFKIYRVNFKHKK